MYKRHNIGTELEPRGLYLFIERLFILRDVLSPLRLLLGQFVSFWTRFTETRRDHKTPHVGTIGYK